MILEARIHKDEETDAWVAALECLCIWVRAQSAEQALEALRDTVSRKYPDLEFSLGPCAIEAGKAVLETKQTTKVVAAALKATREHSLLTLGQVAARLSQKSANSVAAYENAQRQPSISKLEELFDALGKTLVISIRDKDLKTRSKL